MARTDVRELLLAAAAKIAETPPLEEVAPPMPVYKPKEDPRDFIIRRTNANEWRVAGAAIERAAKMTYWEHDGSIRRFHKIMETLGLEDALRKAGVQEGDTVFIGDFELEWQD
jgi:GTP-binding protein